MSHPDWLPSINMGFENCNVKARRARKSVRQDRFPKLKRLLTAPHSNGSSILKTVNPDDSADSIETLELEVHSSDFVEAVIEEKTALVQDISRTVERDHQYQRRWDVDNAENYPPGLVRIENDDESNLAVENCCVENFEGVVVAEHELIRIDDDDDECDLPKNSFIEVYETIVPDPLPPVDEAAEREEPNLRKNPPSKQAQIRRSIMAHRMARAGGESPSADLAVKSHDVGAVRENDENHAPKRVRRRTQNKEIDAKMAAVVVEKIGGGQSAALVPAPLPPPPSPPSSLPIKQRVRSSAKNDEGELRTKMLRTLQAELEDKNAQITSLRAQLKSTLDELNARNAEIYELRYKCTNKWQWTPESMLDVKKLLYYTGIGRLDTFNQLLKHVDVAAPAGCFRLASISTSLTKFEILLLTLQKLRLGTSFRGLSFRFGISERSASVIFMKTIVLMRQTYKSFSRWPCAGAEASASGGVESLRHSCPHCFTDAFERKACVFVDSVEIPLQKPYAQKINVASLSRSKSGKRTPLAKRTSKSTPGRKVSPAAAQKTAAATPKDTATAATSAATQYVMKYLIGVAPCGAIIFVSPGWEGRVSDSHMIETCGLLDAMAAGDVILADSNFNMSDERADECSVVKIRSHDDLRSRLTADEVEELRKIPCIQMHVKRIVYLLKNKFKILNSQLPASILRYEHEGHPILDYIVTVCCAMANISRNVAAK